MPTADPYGFHAASPVLFEAEVASGAMARFTKRYEDATTISVSPGSPPELQRQDNKWGAECRIYFNSDEVAEVIGALGITVETGRPYHPEYTYRVNNNDLWWELVEVYGFELGTN